MNARNPYAPPQADLDTVPNALEEAPPLWNPNAAASWSLVFTPIFGALLHMKNWQALGEPQKAANARAWAIGTLVAFIVLAALSALLADSKVLDGLGRIMGFVLLISWYYASGKPQQNYVVARFGKDYPRRGWTKPLLLAILGIVGYIAVVAVVGIVIASLRHS